MPAQIEELKLLEITVKRNVTEPIVRLCQTDFGGDQALVQTAMPILAIGWIAMRFCADIHSTQRSNPDPKTVFGSVNPSKTNAIPFNFQSYLLTC